MLEKVALIGIQAVWRFLDKHVQNAFVVVAFIVVVDQV